MGRSGSDRIGAFDKVTLRLALVTRRVFTAAVATATTRAATTAQSVAFTRLARFQFEVFNFIRIDFAVRQHALGRAGDVAADFGHDQQAIVRRLRRVGIGDCGCATAATPATPTAATTLAVILALCPGFGGCLGAA